MDVGAMGSGMSPLGQSELIALMAESLRNQDPLNPVTSESIINQVSQLSTVSSLQSLNANFEQLLKLSQLSQGSVLIGREVSYLVPGTTAAQTGVVRSVLAGDGKVFLDLGTERISLDQVKGVGPA